MAIEVNVDRYMLKLEEEEEPNEIRHVKDGHGGIQEDFIVSALPLKDPLLSAMDELLFLLAGGGKGVVAWAAVPPWSEAHRDVTDNLLSSALYHHTKGVGSFEQLSPTFNVLLHISAQGRGAERPGPASRKLLAYGKRALKSPTLNSFPPSSFVVKVFPKSTVHMTGMMGLPSLSSFTKDFLLFPMFSSWLSTVPAASSVQQVVGVGRAGPEVPHLVLLLSLKLHCQVNTKSTVRMMGIGDDGLALPELLHERYPVVCKVGHLVNHRLQLSRFRVCFPKVMVDFIVWLRVLFVAFTLLFGSSFLGSFRDKLPGHTLPLTWKERQ